MASQLRDSAAGFFIRLISGKRWLQYPEEIPGFEFPYPVDEAELHNIENGFNTTAPSLSIPGDEKTISGDDEVVANAPDHVIDDGAVERGEGDEALKASISRIIHPIQTKDGIIVVNWYSTDDTANPHNWGSITKSVVCAEISILTFTVYFGSSAYAPAIPAVIRQFGCSEAVAALGLSLYVIGYGLGPLIFSPLSEVPVLGRNGLYIGTSLMFILLIIPAALTNSLPAFMVARFLAAFFGSPGLSTGPASFTDMLTFNKLPYVLALWSAVTTLGPSIGPIVVGYSLETKEWHWSMFEMLWLASPVWVFLFFFLPETSADNILLRRAARLRFLTGNPNFKAQTELKQGNLPVREILFNALIKPWEMNILDPAILFSTVYVALCYAIFYTFFEAFPLVFPVMYGFSEGASGLPFLSISIGLCIAIPIQLIHYKYFLEPFLVKNGAPVQEFWLKHSLIVTALAPIGLFIFAWTSNPKIYWVVPLIGVVIFQGATYQIMNSQFAYIANIYPKYAASLFAANAAARSLLAGGAILFAGPMFKSLGVGGGVSLLAGIMGICSGLLFVMYNIGSALRKRSRFVDK